VVAGVVASLFPVIVVSLDDTAVVKIGAVIGIVLFFSVVAALLGDAVVEVGLGVDCEVGEVELVASGTVGEGDVSVDPTVAVSFVGVGLSVVLVALGKVGEVGKVVDPVVVFSVVEVGFVVLIFFIDKVSRLGLATVDDAFDCETATPKTQNAKINKLK